MKLLQEISAASNAQAEVTAIEEASKRFVPNPVWGKETVMEVVAKNAAHATQLMHSAMDDHHRGKSGQDAVKAAHKQLATIVGDAKANMARDMAQKSYDKKEKM
jgi:hypothetical protein